MKKALIITGLFLSFWSNTILAQQNKFDRIKALKTAYITNQVNLSSKQAEVFWPIYNRFESELYQLKVVKRRNLMIQIRNKGGINQLTESDASRLVHEYKNLNQAIFLKEQEKMEALEKVLNARELIKLYRAEETFKKELINKLKQARDKRRH